MALRLSSAGGHKQIRQKRTKKIAESSKRKPRERKRINADGAGETRYLRVGWMPGGLRVRRLGFAIDIKLGKETIEKGWGMKNRMFVQTPKASAFPL